MIRGRKERRRNAYSHSTLGVLYELYGSRLPREVMIATVREAISAFTPREGDSAEETRLQLVKKCELSLRERVEWLRRQEAAKAAEPFEASQPSQPQTA